MQFVLSGKLLDTAAVYGVISGLGSLVMPFVSVKSVKCTEESDKDSAMEQSNTLST